MDAKYMELVARCPLLPITSKQQHAAAKAMILELSTRGSLTKTEVGYGKVLVQLIQEYERKLLSDFFVNVTGNEALEYLLNEHGMKQTELAKIAGISKQNINDFLSGRRGLTGQARLRLATHFKVNPEVFALERLVSSA